MQKSLEFHNILFMNLEDKKLTREDLEAMLKATDAFIMQSTSMLQKKYDQIQLLLDSVLDNTRSAIIAEDSKNGVFLKNHTAKELIRVHGEEKIFSILRSIRHPGVFDYNDNDKYYFNISVSEIKSDGNRGFIYLLDDITNIKRMEKERERDERLKLMGGMAANIAHEVRNPLGSIELYASLLARDLQDDPDKKRLTTSIIKGVRTINAVISNTLLFAKEIRINPKEHNLCDITDEVVLYLQHIIREKKVKIINKLDEEHTVYCDEDMFKQVIMNIIGNAVDAVQVGGEITASSKMTDSETMLIIQDNGKGIDQDMLSRLFMPFQTTKAKGTGLGLSIAYKIIKAHGGDIVAKSDSHSWTEFIITLPKRS